MRATRMAASRVHSSAPQHHTMRSGSLLRSKTTSRRTLQATTQRGRPGYTCSSHKQRDMQVATPQSHQSSQPLLRMCHAHSIPCCAAIAGNDFKDIKIRSFSAKAIKMQQFRLREYLNASPATRDLAIRFFGGGIEAITVRVAPEKAAARELQRQQRKQHDVRAVKLNDLASSTLAQRTRRHHDTHRESARTERKRLYEACRMAAGLDAPMPWLHSNPALPPLVLKYDEWTPLRGESSDATEARNAKYRKGEYVPPNCQPLPPDAHIDFWRRAARVPQEWPIVLHSWRFLLSLPGHGIDTKLRKPCRDYKVADASAFTTVHELAHDVEQWLRSQWARASCPEAQRVAHNKNLVVQLWRRDGKHDDKDGWTSTLESLQPTRTLQEEDVYNHRHRLYVTVEEPLPPMMEELPSAAATALPELGSLLIPASVQQPGLLPALASLSRLPMPPPPSAPPSPPLLPHAPAKKHRHRRLLPKVAVMARTAMAWVAARASHVGSVPVAMLPGAASQSMSVPSVPPPASLPPSPAPPPAPRLGRLQLSRDYASHAAYQEYVQRRDANRPEKPEHLQMLNNLLAERAQRNTRSVNLNLPSGPQSHHEYQKLTTHMKRIKQTPIQVCFNCAFMMHPDNDNVFRLPLASTSIRGRNDCRGFRVAKHFIEAVVDNISNDDLEDDATIEDVFRCVPCAPDARGQPTEMEVYACTTCRHEAVYQPSYNLFDGVAADGSFTSRGVGEPEPPEFAALNIHERLALSVLKMADASFSAYAGYGYMSYNGGAVLTPADYTGAAALLARNPGNDGQAQWGEFTIDEGRIRAALERLRDPQHGNPLVRQLLTCLERELNAQPTDAFPRGAGHGMAVLSEADANNASANNEAGGTSGTTHIAGLTVGQPARQLNRQAFSGVFQGVDDVDPAAALQQNDVHRQTLGTVRQRGTVQMQAVPVIATEMASSAEAFLHPTLHPTGLSGHARVENGCDHEHYRKARLGGVAPKFRHAEEFVWSTYQTMVKKCFHRAGPRLVNADVATAGASSAAVRAHEAMHAANPAMRQHLTPEESYSGVYHAKLRANAVALSLIMCARFRRCCQDCRWQQGLLEEGLHPAHGHGVRVWHPAVLRHVHRKRGRVG